MRNLDFAAHASLFKGDFFQEHVIPAKATVLADRLIRTFASFFARQKGLEDLQAEVVADLFTKKILLQDVFEQALRIKAQATISKDVFEMVLYTPGTPFDRDLMDAETMEGDPAKVPFSTKPRVKLCIVPSLHVYGHDRRIVEYNTFVRNPDRPRSAAIKLTKAVVILESTDVSSG